MKAVLEFDLPTDSDSFEIALEAPAYLRALSEIDGFLRNKIKYCELSEEQLSAFQETRTHLSEFTEGLRHL